MTRLTRIITFLAFLTLVPVIMPITGTAGSIQSNNQQGGGAGNASVASVTFPVTVERPIGRPYGASLHFPGELENDTAPSTTSFAQCSFGWTRTCNFLWNTLEPNYNDFSPVYDALDYSNRFLGEMESINTRVLPLIDGPPSWLNDNSAFYISPHHIPLLCKYVNETVTHFQNRMKLWELYNEPNNVWGNGLGSWDEFFAVLIATAETIKRVNTSLEIIVVGLGGYQELEFLDSLMQNLTCTPTSVPGYPTAKDLFIGIAFHPYTSPPEKLATKLMQYDQILSKYNWTNKDGARHWITEIGSETDSPRDGAGGFLIDPNREFGAMMIKQMVIATSWNADGFNIWTYRDFEPPGVYTMDFSHAGIVYSNASWKGVTYACNWSNKFLGNGYMNLMPVTLPPPLAGIVAKDSRFVDGKDRWVIVAWNSQHQGYVDARVEFGGVARGGRIYDYASNASTPLALGNKTTVDIKIGYEPVMLVIDCDMGNGCNIIILSDPAGIFFITLLGVATVLVVGNVFQLIFRRKLKRKGEVDDNKS